MVPQENIYTLADYILKEQGAMAAMKLQKLLYYSQAWSLVWDEKLLFPQRIEAWANGPVVPEVYDQHRRLFKLSKDFFNKKKKVKFTIEQKKTIDAVLKGYGKKSSFELSELTHREAPWKDAREGLEPGERGNREITHSAMAEYYSSL